MNTKDIKSSFQFVGSKVLSCNMKNNFVSADGSLPLKCTVEYTLGESSVNEDLQVLFGIVTLYVNVSATDNESNGKFTCKLIIEGCFADSADCDRDNFSKMLSINGCTLLYSTARAYISTISALSMSDGNFVIPMVNCYKLIEKGQKSSKK